MNDKPVRIQLRRTKGFNLQEASTALNGLDAVKITRPGPFGNPFRVGGWFKLGDPRGWTNFPLIWCESYQQNEPGFTLIETREQAVDFFKRLIAKHPLNVDALRGKNLACFCPLDEPCHADVLLELANA